MDCADCGRTLEELRMVVARAALGIDLMSVSAHKLNGPRGVGALIVNKALPLVPLIHGGGQEHGYRGGTENLAGIVGFGRAAEMALSEMTAHAKK